MTDKKYQQKKLKCFVKFCKDNGIDQKVDISIFDAFDQIFNRAYSLGKQKETVTQEEIEKAAKDYAYNVGDSDWERLIIRDAFVDGANFTLGKHEKDAEVDRTLKVNRQLFCRLCTDADDYINEHLEEDDSDYVYYQGRSDALHELYEDNFAKSEPKPAEPKEDKHFDNILKDSFRDHNRLHIAAMMVPSVIATVPCSENEKGYAKMVATRARILADALISECNKGGKE